MGMVAQHDNFKEPHEMKSYFEEINQVGQRPQSSPMEQLRRL